MLKIDFGQSLLDHRGLLILVQPVGYIGDKPFKGIYEEISTYKRAQVPNTARIIHLRYSKRVTPQFIEWGSFHYHKRVLGLICVAKCSEIAEVEKLEKPINELKHQLSAVLLNTRCFVFGCKSSDEARIRKDFAVIGGDDRSKELQSNLAEFVASLFNVLESKRLSKLSEKAEKISLIQAPVEQEFYGAENDTRAVKKRSIGRSKKYTGDLCMLAGLPQAALSQYCIAAEHLRAVNDVIWLAGSLEGQCAASVALSGTVLPKNCKFLVLPTECAANSVNASSNGLGSDVDETKFRNPVPFAQDEIVEKLSEALRLYGRIRGTMVVEIEAHLKLARLLITYQRRIEASIALENALAVNVALSEQEKIQRFSTAAVLFDELGFSRKAGFFSRIAAMQCVSQQLPNPVWSLSYSFLMSALEGYKISPDQWKSSRDQPYGWPALQTRILNDLIYTSRRLGDPSMAVKHIAFLLQTMDDHLSDSEKMDLSELLESVSKQCAGSPTEKENSKIMGRQDFPMVALTKMPLVKSFKVHSLAPHLKPVGHKTLTTVNPQPSGPFIFSSLRRNPKEARKTVKSATWVCGDVGEVSLEVYNTMPVELKVTNMVLCAKGVEFEAFPACLSLPPSGGPHTVILLGVPHTVGQLRITGYTVNVLGIESTCTLTEENLADKEDFPVIVEVLPPMPQLVVSTTLPQVRSQPTDPDTPQSAPFVTAVTLYAGQRIKGTVTLENIGKIAVDQLNVFVSSKDGEGAKELFSFDDDEINSKLPVLPGKSTEITVTITGAHHFPPGFGSSENLSYDPEAPWGLNGVIHFRYSSGESAMCRRVTASIDVTVVPSLLCDNYKVVALPSDRSRFLLVFDAMNKTSNDMELCYSVQDPEEHSTDDVFVNEVIIIQGNDSNKVTIQLPKFSLPVDDKQNEQTRSDSRRRAEYTKTFRDMVNLRWSLPACLLGGCGNVDNFSLTDDMMNVVKPDPIRFGVKVNGEEYTNSQCSKQTISLCTIVDICVEITNNDDESHGPFILSIDPYQDQANGCPVTELNGKVTWVGTLQQRIPELPHGESFSHCCSLVFLYAGQFMVAVTCREVDVLQREKSRKDNASYSRERSRLSANAEPLGAEETLRNCYMRSWTLRPPIKINVV